MAMHSPRLLLIGGLLFAASTVAQAQAPAGTFAEACRQNARQFCSAMAPGPGLAQCLRDHQAQLTAGCAAAVGRQPASASYAQAGVPEAAPAYPVPPPAPAYPVPEAAAPVYPAPQAAAPAYPAPAGGGYGAAGGYGGGVMAAMQTCRPDLQVHCAGVQPGGGRIAQCLRANFTQLSPVCREALLAARAARQGGASTAYAPRY